MGFLAGAAAETAESEFTIPYAPEVYGIAAMVALLALLAVTWAFRSVGTRHGATTRRSPGDH